MNVVVQALATLLLVSAFITKAEIPDECVQAPRDLALLAEVDQSARRAVMQALSDNERLEAV